MKKMKALITVVAVLLALSSFVVQAHSRGGRYYGHSHRHPGFGFYFGSPWSWYPRSYYPYYPYYPPQIVTVPVEPPVYIERGSSQTQQQLPAGYWYYCREADAYYPYVKECPDGWLQVSPTPEK